MKILTEAKTQIFVDRKTGRAYIKDADTGKLKPVNLGSNNNQQQNKGNSSNNNQQSSQQQNTGGDNNQSNNSSQTQDNQQSSNQQSNQQSPNQQSNQQSSNQHSNQQSSANKGSSNSQNTTQSQNSQSDSQQQQGSKSDSSNKPLEIGKRGKHSDEILKKWQEEEPETPEEQQEYEKRAAKLRKLMDDDMLSTWLEKETSQQKEKEHPKRGKESKGASKDKYVKGSSLLGGEEEFKESLENFLKTLDDIFYEYSYERFDPSKLAAGLLGKARVKKYKEEIPIINVYFDQSSSWEEEDIQIGNDYISMLAEYEDRGIIEVNLFYFSNHVHTTAIAARREGGTDLTEVLNHILETNPDNVIIMTDADADYDPDVKKYNVEIHGAVWFLWKNGKMSTNLLKALQGDLLTESYELTN